MDLLKLKVFLFIVRYHMVVNHVESDYELWRCALLLELWASHITVVRFLHSSSRDSNSTYHSASGEDAMWKHKHLPRYPAPRKLSKISTFMISHLPEDQKENKDAPVSTVAQNTPPDRPGMRQRRSHLQAPSCGSWPWCLRAKYSQQVSAGGLLILPDKRTFTFIIIYDALTTARERCTATHWNGPSHLVLNLFHYKCRCGHQDSGPRSHWSIYNEG